MSALTDSAQAHASRPSADPTAMPLAAPTLVVRPAVRLLERLRGLIGSPAPAPGQALRISPCSSVHTAFMRYSIDVVFVDRHGRIRKVVPALAPWRVAVCVTARHTLELAAGEAARLGLVPGGWLAPHVLFPETVSHS